MSQPSNIFPLSYTGVRAQRPPNITVKNFDPQSTFSQNFDIGDFWINFNPQSPTSAKLWVLLGLAGGVANWVEIVASSGDILTLTGNSGGAVNPVAGNIDIVTANSTVKFIGNNSPANITQDFGLSSLLLGSPGTFLAGALRNVGLGSGALANLSTGSDNTAVGYGALTTASGAHNNNTAIGSLSMTALTTGANNTAVGSDSLSTNTTGDNNIAIGNNALRLFTGSNGVAVGADALAANSSGSFNTAVGTNACAAVTTGDSNTALGFEALQDVVTGSNNTSIGALSLNSTTGSDNTAVGFSALGTVTTGSGNIAIGYEAGLNYVGAESANIVIGNTGTAAEDFTIRIGTQGTQTRAFIAGIAGVSLATPTSNVVIDNSTGQLAVGSGNSDNSPLDVSDNTASAVSPAELNLIKTRAGGPINSGDDIGCLNYIGYDSTSAPITAASICSVSSGTIAAGRVAGDLEFSTHPDSATGATPTLRMTILPAGNVTINKADNNVFGAVSASTATFACKGASIISENDQSDATASIAQLTKTRAGGAITSGDILGAITFVGYDTGSSPIVGAQISSTSSGTIGANRVPANLSFFTHPDSAVAATQRMTIQTTGVVTVLAPDSATAAVQVQGSLSVQGDPGAGVAASTDFTNATAAAGGGAGAVALQAGGVGVAQAGWLKIYVNGVVSYLPYYQ